MPEGITYVTEARKRLTEELPDLEDQLLDLYTLLVLATGEKTTLEDVHDAWSLWRSYAQPDHRSIVPFDELTPAVQGLDRRYMEAIHVAAAKLKAG